MVHLCLAPFVWLTITFLLLCFWPIRDSSGRAVIVGFPFACLLPLLIPVHCAVVLVCSGGLPWFASPSGQSARRRVVAVCVYLAVLVGLLIAARPETPKSGWSTWPAFLRNGLVSMGPIVVVLGAVGRLPFPGSRKPANSRGDG